MVVERHTASQSSDSVMVVDWGTPTAEKECTLRSLCSFKGTDEMYLIGLMWGRRDEGNRRTTREVFFIRPQPQFPFEGCNCTLLDGCSDFSGGWTQVRRASTKETI